MCILPKKNRLWGEECQWSFTTFCHSPCVPASVRPIWRDSHPFADGPSPRPSPRSTYTSMSSGASPATLASSACGCSSCLAKSVAHVTSGGVRRVAPSCLTQRLGLAPARPRDFSRRLHPRIAASDFVGEYTSSSVLRFMAKPSNRIPAARSARHLPSRPAPHLGLRLRLTPSARRRRDAYPVSVESTHPA